MDRLIHIGIGFVLAVVLVCIFTAVKSWWEKEYETLVGRVKVETSVLVYERVREAEERIVSRLAEKEGEHEGD